MFNRRKRNEAFLNALTRLVGYSALVALVASISYVVIQKVSQTSKSDEVYLESVIDENLSASGTGWSGIKESQPALMSSRNSKVDNHKESPSLDLASTSDPKSTTQRLDAARVEAGLPKTDPQISGITNLEAKRPLIEEAVRKFFEAGSIGQKLAFVRDPSRVRPLMNEYYQRQPMPKLKWESLGWTLPVDEPGYRLGYVQAMFSDGDPANLIVEELENGSFAVDWESFVRYGELNWREFLKVKPSQPKLFRVIASKAEKTGTDVADSRLEMIEIKHPGEEGTVFATLDRSDPSLAPVMQQLQSGKWKDVPLTLRLCYPGTSGSGKAVRIAGVEGKGWLILQHTRS